MTFVLRLPRARLEVHQPIIGYILRLCTTKVSLAFIMYWAQGPSSGPSCGLGVPPGGLQPPYSSGRGPARAANPGTDFPPGVLRPTVGLFRQAMSPMPWLIGTPFVRVRQAIVGVAVFNHVRERGGAQCMGRAIVDWCQSASALVAGHPGTESEWFLPHRVAGIVSAGFEPGTAGLRQNCARNGALR
jgi:hypothetical protein